MKYPVWKTSIRDIKRLDKFSILNITGLSIGFTFIILIALFVNREKTYDRFHAKANSIFMLDAKVRAEDGTIQKITKISNKEIEAFETKVPGISNITFLNYSYFDWDNGTRLKFNNKDYQLEKMAFTNAAFADIFSFRVISGNLREALNDPLSLVLTEDNSTKIFGDQNPIGQNVLLNGKPVILKAIIEANPSESSIRFSGLINYKAAQYFTGRIIDDYSNLPFFEVNTKTNIKNIETASREIFLQDFAPEQRNMLRQRLDISFANLKNNYFNRGEAFDPMRHGNITLVMVILVVGILILILAIINYINLSFAGSMKQHKKMAILRISGAGKIGVVLQIISKGILISIIAFVLSLLLSKILLPWFNRLIDYPIDAKNLFRPGFLLLSIIAAIAVGFISGILPALSATSWSPIQLIKGAKQTTSKYTIWKYLMLFQMIISITLIAGTLIIVKQVNFAQNKDVGFNVRNVVTLPVQKLGNKKDVYLQITKNNTQTEAVALSSTYLNTFNNWGGKLNTDGQEKEISFYVVHANDDFLTATKIQLVNGRNFEKENLLDLNSCLINETAAREYGLINPLSAKISGRQIIGVVKDFHIQSLHYQIAPVVIYNSPGNQTELATIRFTAPNSKQVANYMSFLKTNWEKLVPEQPFEYEFLDQRLKNMYEKDERLVSTFFSFSLLAILIACIGLIGLISFITESKIKEIGIRKVNGAKIAEVMTMLNKDFVKWVAIAFILASPIAWYAMHKWLQNFAYKTYLSWWIFAAAGGIAMMIALMTVSWQSWRAATRNPVEALRYE